VRRGWRAFVTALLFSGLTVVSLALPTVSPQTVDALMQEIDEEVPPGNPVIGDDRPGDVPDGDDTNYAGWALVARARRGPRELTSLLVALGAHLDSHVLPELTHIDQLTAPDVLHRGGARTGEQRAGIVAAEERRS